MDVLWASLCAAVLVLAWLARTGAPVKGLPLHSQSGVFGSTPYLLRSVLYDKVTLLQITFAELATNGFKEFTMTELFGKSRAFLFNPADLKYFFQDGFYNFEKGEEFHDSLNELLGDGIFNVDGHKWKSQRTMSSTLFTRRLLRDRMGVVFGQHAHVLLRQITAAAVTAGGSKVIPSKAIDLQPFLYSYTFDVLNMVALDRRAGALTGDKESLAFQEHFDELQKQLPTRFVSPWWKVARMFGLTESERKISKAVKGLNQIMEKLVSPFYDADGKAKDCEAAELTLPAVILNAARDEDTECSKQYLRDVMLNFLLAGRDTTASALCACIEFVCQHPEWQQKLTAEARAIFDAKGSDQETLEFDDVAESAPVADAVFMESLRLKPSVPTNEKTCVKGCTFPSGLEVQKGTKINFISAATNRLPELWGEDAEEFKPDRWITGAARKNNAFMYPTFNAAYRLCLGKDMAILEGKIALLTLFSRLHFRLADGWVPRQKMALTYFIEDLHVEVMMARP